MTIPDQLVDIGAIAGLASTLGLAILALLYFAQAREVRRLRDWAGRAPERDAEAQQRVLDDAARKTAPAPAGAARPAAPKPAAATAATAAGQAAAKPAAPTPAAPKPAAPAVKPAVPAAAPAATTAAATAAPSAAKPAAPAAPSPAAPSAPVPGTPPGEPPPAGAPKSPAAQPPVPATPRPAAPAPATAAAGAASARPRRTVTVGSSSSPASATAAPRRDEPQESRLVSARVLGFTALLAALVVGALFLTGIVGGSRDAPGTVATTPPATTTPAPEPQPADTQVAVLNGTTITGLARTAADALEQSQYQVVRVTDAADQAQQTSQVAFAEGFEATARRVARIVGISSGGIVPLDASTRAVAGDGASVVVTMGADKAQ